ncbi:MAG: ATP-dependent DNA helicase [Ruminococcaceae bacterium]|nr:ATP-dependent DNA helicase [Oscillospiraceae bacterium]
MYYNPKEDRIELSVRELCAMAFLSGDLDARVSPVNPYEAARVGREIHQRLQKERGAAYHSEVTLHHECRLGGVTFFVNGRADGILCDPESGDYTVEEIKTLSRPLWYGGEGFARQSDMGQLICYAYFLAFAKSLSRVTLRLTYVCSADDDIHYQDAIMTADQLRDAFVAVLNLILPRAQDLRNRAVVLRPRAKDAVFPYTHIRDAQGEMIREVWRDMRHGETVFAQAPTGIGKTISTLYPAVKCLGEGRCDKIFYLTAKSATRREAVGAVEKMISAGTPLRAVVIAAREPMCACGEAKGAEGRLTRFCNPETCPYAKGYYDRLEGVMQELLSEEGRVYTPRVISAAAERGKVCPYELSLDLSERCEIVICDYNYVFSPSVYLRRYFAEGVPGGEGNRYIFLVDEAHNLADRARDLYSATLSLSEIMDIQDTVNAYETQYAYGLRGAIFPEEDAPCDHQEVSALTMDDLIGDMRRASYVCRDHLTEGTDGVCRGADLRRESPLILLDTVGVLCKKYDRWLRRHAAHPLYATVDRLTSMLKAFRSAGSYYDEHYATLTEVEGQDIRVSLVCLDPAEILKPILKKAVARVLFSATLTPQDYFADILGGDGDSVCISFDSPFPPERLCVAVADHISLRHEDRQKAVRQVVSYIAATVSAKKGNYLVYFPSYEYMEDVREIFEKKYPKVRLLVQRQGMTAAEREAFISSFSEGDGKLRVGFCVLGGSFSEGVDLPGNSLIGVIILGTGIPGLSSLRNIMAEHYNDTKDGEGYAYAYTYPGMNRVLQAAGRVIRRPEDKGVVVLLDDRYAAPPYTRLYPDHWTNMTAVGEPMSLKEHLERFWEKVEGEEPE